MAEDDVSTALERERTELLARLEDWLETPMLVLAFVWLVLLVLELVKGEGRVFEIAASAIWVVFVLDFALKLALAPRKRAYLRANWLTALALMLPALRIARLGRIARVVRLGRAHRGMRLLRMLSSVNRGMRALGASLGRRGFGYALGLTLVVTLTGAAGMYAFERDVPGSPLTDFGTALWWTAMIVTTMGSDYWPHSLEGRLLCLFLAVYAFAMFGYVTASIATYFVGREAHDERSDIAGGADLRALAGELAALRRKVELDGRRSG